MGLLSILTQFTLQLEPNRSPQPRRTTTTTKKRILQEPDSAFDRALKTRFEEVQNEYVQVNPLPPLGHPLHLCVGPSMIISEPIWGRYIECRLI